MIQTRGGRLKIIPNLKYAPDRRDGRAGTTCDSEFEIGAVSSDWLVSVSVIFFCGLRRRNLP